MKTVEFGKHGFRVRDIVAATYFHNGMGHLEYPNQVDVVVAGADRRFSERFDTQQKAEARRAEILELMTSE